MKYIKRLFYLIMAFICLAIFMAWFIISPITIAFLSIPLIIILGIDKLPDEKQIQEIIFIPFKWSVMFLIKL